MKLEKWDSLPSGPFFGGGDIPTDLPVDYRATLEVNGGREGFLGAQYLRLYRLAELYDLNKQYGVQEANPTLLVFAADGYGGAFAFDRSTWNVWRVPLIPIPIPAERGQLQAVGSTFNEFVAWCMKKPQTHRVNPGSVGKETHMKKPLAFGGDFRDPQNFVMVTPTQHAERVSYWNKLYRKLAKDKPS